MKSKTESRKSGKTKSGKTISTNNQTAFAICPIEDPSALLALAIGDTKKEAVEKALSIVRSHRHPRYKGEKLLKWLQGGPSDSSKRLVTVREFHNILGTKPQAQVAESDFDSPISIADTRLNF